MAPEPLSTLVSVAPKAWQAAKFTLEHVWPWVKEPTRMLDRLIPGRKERRLLQKLRVVADAHRPEDSIRVIVKASPAQGHRVAGHESLGKDVRFLLCIVNIAPFAIRPCEIVNLKIAVHSRGKWICGCQVKNRPIVANYLEGPGKMHTLSVEEPLEWTTEKKDVPATHSAVQLDVSGTLLLHAPWSAEYGEVTFQDSVWIQVWT